MASRRPPRSSPRYGPSLKEPTADSGAGIEQAASGHEYREGESRDTVVRLEDALVDAREREERSAEGSILLALGMLHRNLGEVREAIARTREALPIMHESGEHEGEVETLNNLGSLYQDTDTPRMP